MLIGSMLESQNGDTMVHDEEMHGTIEKKHDNTAKIATIYNERKGRETRYQITSRGSFSAVSRGVESVSRLVAGLSSPFAAAKLVPLTLEAGSEGSMKYLSLIGI